MSPRPRGRHGKDDSTVLAVRVPNDLAGHVHDAAGGNLAEWMRNMLRRAVHVPLDYDAGYYEGQAAGWADAQARLKAALKGA